MRNLIPFAMLLLTACEPTGRGDGNPADTITEEQAIADAEAMIAENAGRIDAESGPPGPEGETQ